MKTLLKPENSTPKQQSQPYFLFVTFWFSTKFKEGSIMKTTINKKQPNTIENYIPGSKFYCLEIVKNNKLPSVKVTYNDHSIIIDLFYFKNSCSPEEQTLQLGNGKLHFVYDKLPNTDKILEKYKLEKPDQDERFRMNECVSDLIRSETQFVRTMEKDEDLEMMKKVQKIEDDIENELSEEIMSVPTFKVSFKKAFIIFFIFMIIGYLAGDPSESKQEKKIKKLDKKKKDKNKTKPSSKPKKKKK